MLLLEHTLQILLLHQTCLDSMTGIQKFQKPIVSFSHEWNEGRKMEESQREMFLPFHSFKASRGIYFMVLAQSAHDSMHHEL